MGGSKKNMLEHPDVYIAYKISMISTLLTLHSGPQV